MFKGKIGLSYETCEHGTNCLKNLNTDYCVERCHSSMIQLIDPTSVKPLPIGSIQWNIPKRDSGIKIYHGGKEIYDTNQLKTNDKMEENKEKEFKEFKLLYLFMNPFIKEQFKVMDKDNYPWNTYSNWNNLMPIVNKINKDNYQVGIFHDFTIILNKDNGNTERVKAKGNNMFDNTYRAIVAHLTLLNTPNFRNVLDDAQNVFWTVVAENYPDVKTGDFGPEETFIFNEACITAIKKWLKNNQS